MSIEWISHRGLHGDEANGIEENTHGAFQHAVKDGFEWLETDLRISTDDVIFLAHDPSLQRIAGKQLLAELRPWADLSTIPLNDGQHLVRLDEFIEAYSSKKWVFDIKPESGLRTLQRLCEDHLSLLRDRSESIWFQIWQAEHRQYLLSRLPGARIFPSMARCYQAGFSSLLGLPWFGRIEPDHMFALPPTFQGINLYRERMMTPYRSRNAQLLAYLPQKNDEIQAALKLPFTLLLTNRKKSSFVSEDRSR